jgi:peptidoglycan hydrolase FlgJ
MTISGISLSPNAPPERDVRPERIEDAARQFEALLISQLLKSMREAGSGWLGTGDDSTSSSAMELAEEQFAQSLAAQGGLGLARLVAGGLRKD